MNSRIKHPSHGKYTVSKLKRIVRRLPDTFDRETFNSLYFTLTSTLEPERHRSRLYTYLAGAQTLGYVEEVSPGQYRKTRKGKKLR